MRIPVTTAAPLLVALFAAGCGADAPATRDIAPPTVATLVVAAGSASEGSVWDGVVEATRSATLSAQTSGRIAEVAVDVDDAVKSGQALARITATEQAASTASARAQLRAAESLAAETDSRYARAAELIGRQLISQQDFEQVRAARDSAAAARDSAAAQLAQIGQQLAYTTVRAPFGGVVMQRLVEPGETVVPGQALLAMYAPGELRVEVRVPQSDAPAIRESLKAQVRRGDGRSIEAARVIVYPGADPATHSVTVRVLLPDMTDPPRPGETVTVVFPAAGAPPTELWIPAAAVVRRGELTAVYVVNEGGLALRQLRLGREQGDRVQVLAGLAPGESIAGDPVEALAELVSRRDAASGTRE